MDTDNNQVVCFEEVLDFMIMLQQEKIIKKASFIFDLISHAPNYTISFIELILFFLIVFDEFETIEDPSLIMEEDFDEYINGSVPQRKRFLEYLSEPLVKSISSATSFFNLLDVNLSQCIEKDRFLKFMDENPEKLELLNFLDTSKMDTFNKGYLDSNKSYLKQIESMIEELKFSLNSLNMQESQIKEKNPLHKGHFKRNSTLNIMEPKSIQLKRNSFFKKDRRPKMKNFSFNEIFLNQIREIDDQKKNKYFKNDVIQEHSERNSDFFFGKNSERLETSEIRYTLSKLKKIHKQMKEEDVIRKKSLFKSIESINLRKRKTSKKIMKAKKKFKNKELRPYDKESLIATCFTRGLNKALLLLGSHKHQVPCKIDFQLENKISLSNPKKHLSNLFDYYEFTDFSPLVFQRLRYSDGISNEKYIQIIGFKDFKTLFSKKMTQLKHEKSTGQSGSFFFVSSCGKFFIKSIRKQESKVLKKILPAYFNHLQANPKSLLNRFYGFYKITFFKNKRQQKELFFVVMNNLFFDVNEIAFPEKVFDLKGSTYKREVGDKMDGVNLPGKDLDFIKFKKSTNLVMKINREKKQKLLNNLLKDSMFLATRNIIDYRYFFIIFTKIASQ